MATKEEIIWKHKKATELWCKEISLKGSGIVDEKYVKEYIASKRNVKVVSLGIGSGRELNWLDKLRNIKGVIGIDYSPDFLDICRKVADKCKVKVICIKDNLFSLKRFKRFIKNERLPLIYICLLNTLGNFTQKEREKVLKNVRNLMKRRDRLVLCLYKRPERIKAKIKLPSQIKIKGNSGSRIKLGTLIEYGGLEFLWIPILEKYHQLPRFWYNEKTDDVTIYVGKEKILISHRFSKEEIKELAKIAKLKIEKIIEGKFMWVVILKV
jgi:ubiquinone/menaquinone biosynthesis C-methylase UbiE